MPVVTRSIEINAPIDKVFSIAQKAEDYPSFMSSIRSVQVLEEEGDRRTTEWIARVEELGRTIRWTEEDIWDKERRECRFRSLKGDFTKYEGLWSFKDMQGRTSVSLTIEYEMKIPLIGALLQGLIKRKVEETAEEMLESLKERCESEEV